MKRAMLLAGLIAFGAAHGQLLTAEISGFEVFPGVPLGDVKVGTTFAGWTHGAQQAPGGTPWIEIAGTDGGVWHASVTYQGTPGIEDDPPRINTVYILSGNWFRSGIDGSRVSGAVLPEASYVNWPPDLTATLDVRCGPGVATFRVTLAVGDDLAPAGSIVGCLDDTHLDKVFPPKIWGTLSLDRL